MTPDVRAEHETRDLREAIDQFARDLERDQVDATLALSYAEACRSFADWMDASGYALDMDSVAEWHVEDWEADLRAGPLAGSFHDRHRGLQRFLGWYKQREDANWRLRSAWRHAAVGPTGS